MKNDYSEFEINASLSIIIRYIHKRITIQKLIYYINLLNLYARIYILKYLFQVITKFIQPWKKTRNSLKFELQLTKVKNSEFKLFNFLWFFSLSLDLCNYSRCRYCPAPFYNDKLAIKSKILNLTDWILTLNFLIISPSYAYKKKLKYSTFFKSIWCNCSRMNQNQ